MPLKKQLGLLPVVLSGIGVILGAGIYALIGEAAGIAGYGLWIGFVIAALVAAFTGLSYAELSAMIPKAGAEFNYAKKAFNRKIGFFTAWLLILAGVISAATVAWAFGSYLNALTGFPVIPAAVMLSGFCTLVIFTGVKQSTSLAGALTIIEILGLIIIIAIGLPLLSSSRMAEILNFSGFSIASMFQAAALVFFAYLGFEEIVKLSEETKNPEKNIPKALIIAIAVSTILYVLVAFSALSVLTPEQLASSNAPLGDVAGTVLGGNAFLLLSFIALVSTASTALLILLSTSRIIYGIAKDNEIPHIIARIDKNTQNPTLAVFAAFILSVIFLFFGSISIVANATDFLLFVAFVIVNASVIKLRYSLPNLERPFRIPFSIGRIPITAVLGIIACIALALNIKPEIMALGIAVSVLGIIFEHYYERKHKRTERKSGKFEFKH